MPAMVLIILLLCARRRDAGNPGKSSREALSPTSTIPAMDVIPATPHVGTAAEAIVHTAIPGPLPTALHIVLPMVHPLGTPHIPKDAQLPTGTTRTLIDVIPTDSITTGSQAEGKLFMERASDGQVVFYTRLDLPARSGTMTMVVKIDPGAQVKHHPLEQVLYTLP